MKFNIDHIFDQAIAELPQEEMNEENRLLNAAEYINEMTNVELLELIDRAFSED